MFWIPLIISAVSAAASAAAQIQAGAAQKDIAERNAQQEQNNAIQAQQDAMAAASAMRRDKDKLEKRQRALYAKGGVQTEGTPLLTMIDSAQEMELMALEIERGGDIKSAQHRSQAAIDKFTGRAAMKGAYYGAGATLLQGASNVAGRYQNFKFNGVG